MSKKSNVAELRIVVAGGEDWPELSPEDVEEEVWWGPAQPNRGRHATLLIVIFGSLFGLYSVYAMVKGDTEMLRSGFDFVKLALAASVSWVFGRRSITRL